MGQLLLGQSVNLLLNLEKSEDELLRNLYFYHKSAAKVKCWSRLQTFEWCTKVVIFHIISLL